VYDKVGAQASANLPSLVLTCRVNGIQSFDYLQYLFEVLPAAKSISDVEALLPWNLKPILEEQERKKRQEACRQATLA
jgi:hypothetical protein